MAESGASSRARGVDRLTPIATSAARAAGRVALAAAVAAAVIVVFLLRGGWPDDRGAQLSTVVGIAAATVPPAVLALFAHALAALAKLPDRIRTLPGSGRERAAELGRLVAEVGPTRRRRRLALPVALWRLGRAVAESRELLTPHAAVLPLFSLSFLGWAAVAGAAALVEVGVAAVLLLVMLLG